MNCEGWLQAGFDRNPTLNHNAQLKKLIQIVDQAPSQVRTDGGEISQADLGQTEGAIARLKHQMEKIGSHQGGG